jgi:hypothetical protein
MLYAIRVEAGCVCPQVKRTGETQRFHYYVSQPTYENLNLKQNQNETRNSVPVIFT